MSHSSKIPLVSVVMTVYNTEAFLPASIESILNQTLNDFEFIIVDDGSTDNSLTIINNYAKSDDRITVLQQKNQGISRAANAGIHIATGTFIARMDSDDISRSDRLEKQSEFLCNNPKVVAVGSWFNTVNSSGSTIPATKFGVNDSSVIETPIEHTAIDTKLLSGGLAISHPSSMIRRDAIRSLGGYKVEYVTSEDRDLFLRLSEIGSIHNLEDVLLSYRIREGQVSSFHHVRQQYYSVLARRSAYRRRRLIIPDVLSFNRLFRLKVRLILTRLGLYDKYLYANRYLSRFT